MAHMRAKSCCAQGSILFQRIVYFTFREGMIFHTTRSRTRYHGPECPFMCRFSDAGKTCSRRADAAGVRKAPRHEIAVGGAPCGAASAMGIWAGRACQCDLMAAVRMIALGQKIAESTLKARPVRCASGFGVGLRAGMARRCKRGGCRARASENGGGRCGGGSMVPAS
jgi:hypothetical protein